MKQLFLPKKLGEVLQEANLVSRPQIEVALRDQFIYEDLRLGEILALRGWLKKETADFFAEQWYHLLISEKKRPLGYYLKSAALLNEEQIKAILKEQSQLGVRFGSVAVLHGWLKDQTLEFFLKYLAPENKNKSPFIEKYSLPETPIIEKKTSHQKPKKQTNPKNSKKRKLIEEDTQLIIFDAINSIKTNKLVTEEELEDIPWI